MRRAIILAAALCAASPLAHAQAWRPVERECAEAIARQYGCTTSCDNRLWPLYARCAVEKFYGAQIPASRLDACMQPIWDRRWAEHTCAACGDPVAESIRCAGGE
jgi:hypothetical protein